MLSFGFRLTQASIGRNRVYVCMQMARATGIRHHCRWPTVAGVTKMELIECEKERIPFYNVIKSHFRKYAFHPILKCVFLCEMAASFSRRAQYGIQYERCGM